jgi:hypothetical protein
MNRTDALSVGAPKDDEALSDVDELVLRRVGLRSGTLDLPVTRQGPGWTQQSIRKVGGYKSADDDARLSELCSGESLTIA